MPSFHSVQPIKQAHKIAARPGCCESVIGMAPAVITPLGVATVTVKEPLPLVLVHVAETGALFAPPVVAL